MRAFRVFRRTNMPNMNTAAAPAIEAHTAVADGSPMTGANRVASMTPEDRAKLDARFWAKTKDEPETGCVLWIGGAPGEGYGTFRIAAVNARAHRVSYVMAHGPIPMGLVVRHTCHRPRCINPAHLIVGTQAENAQDMLKAGRAPRGPGSNPRKLCAIGALIIRGDNILGVPVKETARNLGVHVSTVAEGRAERRWEAAMTDHVNAELAKKPKKAKPRRA